MMKLTKKIVWCYRLLLYWLYIVDFDRFFCSFELASPPLSVPSESHSFKQSEYKLVTILQKE